jgi:phage/plasmid-like protein (TIGR03299 family)
MLQTPKLGTVAFHGEQPWKSNGNEVDPKASLGEWQKAAGLDYEVVPCPSLYRFNDELRTVPNRVQLVRSDTGNSLSEMSGTSYKIRQPAEILEFFRNLVDTNQLQMKVVGQMQEGRKIFALAERVGHEVEIGKNSGDILRQNVFLIESFDGSHATKAIPKAMRLFCLNQITPFGGYRGGVNRKHSQSWDIEGVQLELAAMDEQFGQFVEAAQEMAKFKMTQDMIERYFARIYVPEAFENLEHWRKSKLNFEAEGVSTNQRNVMKDLLLTMEDNLGAHLTSAEGTLYGALNTVTFYQDHEARTKGNKRFESAMIGAGNRTKDEALSTALELIKS